MTTTNATTYTTREYANEYITVHAGDTATITKTYATKWGTFCDVQTAHNGMLNVRADMLDLILCTNQKRAEALFFQGLNRTGVRLLLAYKVNQS